MILPDDRPPSPTKQQPGQHPEEEPLLPAYQAQSSQPYAGPSAPPPMPVPVPMSAPVFHVERGESAERRFVKAFLVAVAIYLLLVAVTSSIVEIGRYPRHSQQEYEDIATARPHRSDGTVLQCVRGSDHWKHGGENPTVSFALKDYEQALYLFARGTQLGGRVNIVQDGPADGVVRVDVEALRSTPRWLHAVTVCALERAKHEQGVGIFTPQRWRSRPWPEFTFAVTLHLPRSSDVLQINKLDTNMPNFAQSVDDLAGHVFFQDIFLRSSNAPLTAKSLNATHAKILTSNHAILGEFQASDSLSLKTSNGRINASATLAYSDPPHTVPTLDMRTTNGMIDSAINLLPAHPGQSDAQFKATVATSNSPIWLWVPTAPVDSVLDLGVGTSNGRVHAELHPTFEGAFHVQTSNDHAAVYAGNPADPAGRGRERHVEVRGSGREVQGSVKWDARMWRAGKVDVRTSNAKAELYL